MSKFSNAQNVSAYFDKMEVNHAISDEGDGIVSAFGGKNFDNIRVIIDFDGEPGGEFATIVMFGIAKAPGSLVELAEPLMAEFNAEYRWGRWNLSDHDIVIDQNIYLPSGDAEGAGEIVFNHLMSMLAVVDDAYPKLMRKIYG